MHNSVLIVVLVFGWLQGSGSTQEPAEKPVTEAALTRACPASTTSRPPKTKPPPKAAHPKEPVSVCVEAKGSAIDLQDFFESYARRQRWRIADERYAEDSWIFSRTLDKNELLQYAKEGPLAGRVHWTEGKAVIQIIVRQQDGGFARVEISARLQGGGESVDSFAPPRESWDLDSNGALEKELVAGLEAHLKSLHN
jgi:hypothetical protein